LDASPVRWPKFSEHAFRAGYRCVHATPIRLRTDTIGVLNLFRRTPEVLGEADRHLSRALADATAISLVQQASLDHHRTVNRQLQRALVATCPLMPLCTACDVHEGRSDRPAGHDELHQVCPTTGDPG
ncbi:hypothetical protein ABT329_26310, partial [Streptomyces minutiscleroticus]